MAVLRQHQGRGSGLCPQTIAEGGVGRLGLVPMVWVRRLIWVGLAAFVLSTMWLILSGRLGSRLDESRANRQAEKEAAEAARYPSPGKL